MRASSAEDGGDVDAAPAAAPAAAAAAAPSLSFLAFFYAFFLIPETSGIPLEKMERLFEIKPIWKANETLKEELAREEERFRTDVKGRATHKENGGGGGSE